MKKITLVITLLFNAVLFSQTTFTVNDFEYTVTDNTNLTVKVTDYTGSSLDVNIPIAVIYDAKDYRVSSIGEGAFEQKGLTSVTIPTGVTSIGDGAFILNNLTSVTIPYALTSIGKLAFAYNNLEGVIIPNNVTSIGELAFSNNSLTSVISKSTNPATLSENVFDDNNAIDLTIPTGREQKYKDANWTGFNSYIEGFTFTIDNIEYTLTDGVNLTVEVTGYTGLGGDVNIPNLVNDGTNNYSVTSIGLSAFASSNLTSVTIPNTVTSIKILAFAYNPLESVTIPNGVTSIEGYAFFNNDFLTSVTIPNTVTHIGERAFHNSDLTSVTIPDSVTYIGSSAFAENNLGTITIGSGVTYIGEKVFAENTSLTSVTIPDNVTYIGSSAFAENNNLGTITIGSGVTHIGEMAFHSSALTNVTIPDNVTYIGSSAFAENNNLGTITIGSGVTHIGEKAFSGNTSLTSVISKSTNPATLPADAFDNRNNIDLTTPTGTELNYTNANWTGFKNSTLSIDSMSLKNKLTIVNTAHGIRVNTANDILIEKLVVFNMSGVHILTSKETTISTSTLAHGVYILQVTTNKGRTAKKFLN
ncbi:leucine-rich repeat domain-containing protein [Flavivirga jejuensis]|uniref:Leucine-rich repeat domain-containing protein n=1 Tax=Flavivirga jejuensis TaxID=870487 RepID=A0ABT8WJW4_9FLAO|nr:leucine-rich repeat domain-containing protein [Flavivirga jejuensis]MDO5973242.1 leucine-rich repeat domain-containing protein [Flavivirga jejuensis]